MGSRRRAVHAGERLDVRLVPRPDARWTHESLGPHLAPHGTGRLQAAQPRRTRRRLADYVRRPQAVLRQARPAGRDLRLDGKYSERARWYLSAAAQASLLRAVNQSGGRYARDHLHSEPPVDPHAAVEWTPCVPLLRTVRPRLRDVREFFVAV